MAIFGWRGSRHGLLALPAMLVLLPGLPAHADATLYGGVGNTKSEACRSAKSNAAKYVDSIEESFGDYQGCSCGEVEPLFDQDPAANGYHRWACRVRSFAVPKD